MKGTMEVLEDKTAKEMIWRDGDTMYYANGVDDPDYCVLKFTATEGRYYSKFKSEIFLVDDAADICQSGKFHGKSDDFQNT